MYWNVPEMSKFMKFLKFLAFPGHSGIFWSKMTQKMWPFDSYQKCTELFLFRLSAFPKKLEIPKLLPKGMSLIDIE